MGWLALGYPVLAHIAVVLRKPGLQWLAMVWLLAVALWYPLSQRRWSAWAAWLAGSATAFPLAMAGNGLYALYLPPVLMPLGLLVLFAHSLRAGEVPLVTRIATLMRGAAPPDELLAYTRRVTQVWCGVFVLLAASALAFALCAAPAVWSVMTNCVHYLIIGAVFVLEFSYRRMRYRQYEHDGLLRYLWRLAHTRLHG